MTTQRLSVWSISDGTKVLIEVAATDASNAGQIAQAYLNLGKSKYLLIGETDRTVIVEVGSNA